MIDLLLYINDQGSWVDLYNVWNENTVRDVLSVIISDFFKELYVHVPYMHFMHLTCQNIFQFNVFK